MMWTRFFASLILAQFVCVGTVFAAATDLGRARPVESKTVSEAVDPDMLVARRRFEANIKRDTAEFVSHSKTPQHEEPSQLIDDLTLAGVTEFKTSARGLAVTHWRAALSLYHRYLPGAPRRLADGDVLIEAGRCSAAFAAYADEFQYFARKMLPALQAAEAKDWATAEKGVLYSTENGITDVEGNTSNDFVRGLIAVCESGDAGRAEGDFVDSMADYDTTTSSTPQVGPVEASAIRLTLHEMGVHAPKKAR